MYARFKVLPDRGTLIISADLHGNLEDYQRLREIFSKSLESEPDTHWVVLGDAVHGPDTEAAREQPDLYGFDDGSWKIIEDLISLQEIHPGRVHYILGNHDHGHVGGRRTAKFYPDEVAALESKLLPVQVSALQSFFQRALLAVAAPCGLLLTHAAPDGRIDRLADLDRVSLDPGANEAYSAHLLHTFLWPYGQTIRETGNLLRRVSRDGPRLQVLVHGHDRDEHGYFTEGEQTLCPVVFGAPRSHKRYLKVDLSSRYRRASDLREDYELLRLYPAT